MELQRLQKSEDGPHMARLLLSHHTSPNCRFFGALTYTVIINNGIAEADVLGLVRLQIEPIKALLETEHYNATLFIVKKLLSNLSLLFIQHSNVFDAPLRWLVLALGDDGALNASACIESLSQLRLSILLLFSLILVEDICKQESANSAIHERIASGATFELTSRILARLLPQVPTEIDLQALDCIMSWVTYTSLAESRSAVRYQYFKCNFMLDEDNNTTKDDSDSIVIAFLLRHFNLSMLIELVAKAVAVATEILEINPRLLSPDSRQWLKVQLFSREGFGALQMRLLLGSDGTYHDELCGMVTLMTTLLSHDMLHLAKTLTCAESEHLLAVLVDLTNFPGTAIEEETISDLLLPFWEDLCNVFVDDEEMFAALFANEPALVRIHFEQTRNSLFQHVCSIYWRKAHLPQDPHVLASLGAEFIHYRNNVADLFIASYSLLKEPFYLQICDNVVAKLDKIDGGVADLESSLFLLYKVTDDCLYLESLSTLMLPHVERIFAHGLIPRVQSQASEDMLHSHLYSTTVNFVSSVQFYFKSPVGSAYLGDVLDMLFGVVLGNGERALSLRVSRTILKICQECRQKLVDYLPNLEQLLGAMLRNPNIDNVIRQRIANCYTSIARCFRQELRFGLIVKAELEEIHSCALSALLSADSLETEAKVDYLVSLLACVVEVGKSCQIPEEADEFFELPQQQQEAAQYWNLDPLGVQALVLEIIEKFSLGDSPAVLQLVQSTVTEKCCLIIKSGLSESFKGPFVFDITIILDYVAAKMDDCASLHMTSSVPYLYGLAECVININSSTLTPPMVDQLLQKIFLQHVFFLKTDPDMVHSCISMFATILEKKPSLVIYNQMFASNIVDFGLYGLLAQESLVVRVSLRFWLTLLALKKGSFEDQTAVKDLMVTTNCGQIFVHTLLQSFIDSPRSNLDYYYQVFRNLIAKFAPHFKNWMLIVRPDISVKGERGGLDPRMYDNFISKLVLTRGLRTTNEVLKTFWLQVNGLVEFSKVSY